MASRIAIAAPCSGVRDPAADARVVDQYVQPPRRPLDHRRGGDAVIGGDVGSPR
ncbi:hypothetical protein [Spongiactinospora rosea]|uniref:hypothetical protein n=1 Tax=Spongiactinospora rosea TaxID=2248750 RepID=UPI0013144425|nr:hypothetical protein [Spongiactinospora rosea]